MPLKQPVNLGTVYNKNLAGGLGTSPTASSTMNADRASLLRFEVTATLAGGSTAGNVTVAAKGSQDGTNFDPITLTDDSAGTSGATGTVTTSAGSTVKRSFSLNPSAFRGGVQIFINTAGAPNAADVVSILATAA